MTAAARRSTLVSRAQSAGPASASSIGGGSKPSIGPEHDHCLARALGIGLGVDDDDLAGAELLPEEPLGQRVLDQALDGPAQRPGAERRVVAPVGEEDLGRVGELEADALALELRARPA